MILVTGGTGVVGSALVSALVERRRPVCILSRTPERQTQTPRAVAITRADLRDPASLEAALDGVEAVVHLAAALPRDGMTAETIHAVNTEGTGNLARAAAARRVRQFVYVSSAGVYGNSVDPRPRVETDSPRPQTIYENTKLGGENAMRQVFEHAPTSWVILRPCGIHGPRRRATVDFYRQIARQRFWFHGPARVIVHPTYINDVVSSIMSALEQPQLRGEIFNIGGAEALEFPRLVSLVADRLGTRVRHIKAPAALTGSLALATTTAWRRVGSPPEILERLASPVINRSVDISKARRVLGFEPYPLVPGIEETIAWARQERLL